MNEYIVVENRNDVQVKSLKSGLLYPSYDLNKLNRQLSYLVSLAELTYEIY